MHKRKAPKEVEVEGHNRLKEPKVFITESRNVSSKYFAMGKQRFIDVNGQVVGFTSLDELQSVDEKDDGPETAETIINEYIDISETPVSELNYPLNSEEQWNQLSSLLRRNKKEESIRINVTNINKTERTLMRKSIEERYQGKLTTNTITEDQQKYIVIGTDKNVDHDGTIIEIVSQPDVVEQDCIRIFRWGDNPAKLFFDLFRQKSQDLKDQKIKTQKKMFEAIAQGMIERGYDVSLTIVQNRYKWCRKKYFQMRKNVDIHIPQYLEDALEEMFGSGHSSQPVATISSSSGLKMNSTILSSAEKNCFEEVETSPIYMDLSGEETETGVNNISPPYKNKKFKVGESPKVLLRVAESLSSFISESTTFQKQREKMDQHLLKMYKKEIESANKFRQELLEVLKKKKS